MDTNQGAKLQQKPETKKKFPVFAWVVVIYGREEVLKVCYCWRSFLRRLTSMS